MHIDVCAFCQIYMAWLIHYYAKLIGQFSFDMCDLMLIKNDGSIPWVEGFFAWHHIIQGDSDNLFCVMGELVV